LKTIIVTKKEN